jgi:two-component system, LytTR family, sensor histidine kinase AlgZ
VCETHHQEEMTIDERQTEGSLKVVSSRGKMSSIVDQPANRKSFARTLVLILCINASSGLAVFVLNWLMTEGMTNAQLVSALTTSLVYGNCCGTIMALVMPQVGLHCARKPFPLSWVYYLSALLILAAIGCLISVFILTRIGVFRRADYWPVLRSTLVVAIVIALVIGVSKYLYEGLKHRLEVATRQLQIKELEEERSRKLAAEARLSSLESRIHPHFLFNTLNSISSLIQEDPRLAERLVERLAALLRFSLDSNQASTVPLSREMKIVTDYLEIEKARFGDKLKYSIDVPAELEAIEVPPLSVQTLVENSVKHVVAGRREGGEVRITARAVAGRVNIEVLDDGPGFTADSIKAGHGLDNLQSRLTALFDERAALELATRDGQTAVTISLPGSAGVTPAYG